MTQRQKVFPQVVSIAGGDAHSARSEEAGEQERCERDGSVIFRGRRRSRRRPRLPRMGGRPPHVLRRGAATRLDEQRLQLIFDRIPAIVWTVDRLLRYTSGIGGGLTALGVTSDGALTGVSLYEYFQTDAARSTEIQAHLRALAGEPVTYESRWHGRTYHAHLEPLRDARGEIVGVTGVALDITERKLAEEERDRLLDAEREARAAAERAVRIREDFLSVASHELRTPVTSLQLVVQSVLRGVREGTPAVPVEMMSIAERQITRLKALIDQLLDVARIQSGRLTLDLDDVDLAAEARSVVERLKPELDQAKTPVILRAESPVVGCWDRSRIDQLMTNLVSNALKYGAGQPIQIEVGASAEGQARITVRDHGIGIAADRIDHIFGRFERAVSNRNYGGLGLGLYIVDEIVRAHGGAIKVESELGKGSTFIVDLPTQELAALDAGVERDSVR
jgi:PAS domain S-box-containing protein